MYGTGETSTVVGWSTSVQWVLHRTVLADVRRDIRRLTYICSGT